ncbi:MAG: hypothetical protein M3Q65_23865 [Chloroflexota bacterium]|nr:hypothetical protein [Chloroflexota bacterium]
MPLAGTRYLPPLEALDGAILFREEIGGSVNNIYIHLHQFKRLGMVRSANTSTASSFSSRPTARFAGGVTSHRNPAAIGAPAASVAGTTAASRARAACAWPSPPWWSLPLSGRCGRGGRPGAGAAPILRRTSPGDHGKFPQS